MAFDSVGGKKSARTGSVENFFQGRAGCTDKTRAMKNVCLQICEEGHTQQKLWSKQKKSEAVALEMSSYKKQSYGSFS